MIKSDSADKALVGACTLTLPVVAFVSLSATGLMTATTGAAIGVLLAGAGWIALTTWRNAQSTENVSHVLNRAETRPPERR